MEEEEENIFRRRREKGPVPPPPSSRPGRGEVVGRGEKVEEVAKDYPKEVGEVSRGYRKAVVMVEAMREAREVAIVEEIAVIEGKEITIEETEAIIEMTIGSILEGREAREAKEEWTEVAEGVEEAVPIDT